MTDNVMISYIRQLPDKVIHKWDALTYEGKRYMLDTMKEDSSEKAFLEALKAWKKKTRKLKGQK